MDGVRFQQSLSMAVFLKSRDAAGQREHRNPEGDFIIDLYSRFCYAAHSNMFSEYDDEK